MLILCQVTANVVLYQMLLIHPLTLWPPVPSYFGWPSNLPLIRVLMSHSCNVVCMPRYSLIIISNSILGAGWRAGFQKYYSYRGGQLQLLPYLNRRSNKQSLIIIKSLNYPNGEDATSVSILGGRTPRKSKGYSPCLVTISSVGRATMYSSLFLIKTKTIRANSSLIYLREGETFYRNTINSSILRPNKFPKVIELVCSLCIHRHCKSESTAE